MSKCSFRNEWINQPKFSWLREVPNNKGMAFCVLCNANFSLSNMGLRAVSSHKNGKKHQQREKDSVVSKSVQNLFSMSALTNQSLENTSSSTCPPGTSELQSQGIKPLALSAAEHVNLDESQKQDRSQFPNSVQRYFFKDNVTKSEILWCLEVIMTHKSLRSAEKDVKLFSKLFPDSEIAKCMQLGRDKIAYTIVYGISPFFKENLIEELLSCSYIVIGFDESMNKVSQKQQMDLNVRFWCQTSNEVKTRYLNSAFLGRTRASDLLTSFKEATHPLNLKKLLQVSMDGPHVNNKFFKELSYSLKETPEDPELLNIGSCGLHAINIAFKTGVLTTNWKVVEFNRSLYYLFKDSPARRALYTFYSGSDKFPLKFCFVRWLENSGVAERSLSIIPHVKKFVDGVEKDKAAPTSKSYLAIKNAITDPLLPAKLAFFQLMATDVESFLREYQTDTPLIPFLYSDLSCLMQRLMRRFMQKDALKKNVMEIDLSDKSNFLPFRQVDIGISTQCQLKKLKVSDAQISEFKNECRNFLIKFVAKLQERSPLIYELTKAVSCFDPRISVNENLFSKRLTKLLLIFCEKNWISSAMADKVKITLKEICCQPHVVSKLKLYKRTEQRIDHFWWNLLCAEQNSSDSMCIVKMVLILSHGNANVERGFSINRECLGQNMKEESLIARRLIYDSMLSKGGLDNFEISKHMILHARNARSKFAEAVESKKKQEKEKAALTKRKRDADVQMKNLEQKKAKIVEEAQKESLKIDDEIAALRLLQKKV